MSRIAGSVRPLMAASVMLYLFAAAAPALAQLPTASIQTGPRLDFPAGLATDNRTVWISSARNNTITAVDVTSHSITLVAGTNFQNGNTDGVGAAARFDSPDGLVVVGRSLYVADTNNSDIRKVNLDTRAVTTFAGTANISGTEDGHGTAAHFNLPTQLASDGTNIFVADSGNNTVRRINIADVTVKTIGGQPQQQGNADGGVKKSMFNGPRGVATDGKFVYVADTGNEVIRKIDLSTLETTTLAGDGQEGNKDGAGKEAEFSNPGALCMQGQTLYVMDADNHAIRKIDLASDTVKTLTLVNGHIGSGCTVSSDGGTLYYSDTTENSVQATNTTNGNFVPLYPLTQ
jgi:sugar lactone lactonase YvrE